jgi:hypothetical protein
MVSSAADKHKPPVTIAALDIAALINFKPDARMAKRGTARNIAGTIAGDAAGFDFNGLGCLDHRAGL